MVKLDVKDRRILFELDSDARQSLTQIGKKVGLKKDVVAYRVKRMQDEGVIKNFYTVIDAFKLGYNVFRIYLQFQDIPVEKKAEIIAAFTSYKYTWSVYSVVGPFDLGAIIWIKNVGEFYSFYDELLDRYSKYLGQKIVSIYVRADEYERTYLLPEDHQKRVRRRHSIVCDGTRADIDKVDYVILNELALNARMPLVDLAKKLNLSGHSVNYRIASLMKSGVIKSFRVTLDISKLGLQYFDLRINLSDHSKRKPIVDYLKDIPSFKCLNTTIGYSDLELEFHVKDMEAVNQILDDIHVKFPGSIRNHFYLRTRETHRERWVPEFSGDEKNGRGA